MDNYINQWRELEDAKAWRSYLLRNLHLFAGDETAPAHLSQRLKSYANSLLATPQRHKALQLAETLLWVGLVLGTSQPRARNLTRARGLMVRGNYYYREGAYTQAEQDYHAAERLCQENDSPLEALRFQPRLINIAARLGRLSEALALIEPAVRQAEAAGDTELLLLVLSNVGATYLEGQEYFKAEELYKRMLEVVQAHHPADLDALHECYRNLAECYLFLNRPRQALEMASQGREIAQNSGNFISIATTDWIIATAYFWMGHYTKALRVWNNSLELFEKADWQRDAYVVKQWKCICLIKLNRLEESLELSQVLALEAQKRLWITDQANTLYWQCHLLTQLGRYGEALEVYEQAVQLVAASNLPNWSIRLRLRQTELLLKMGEYAKAQAVLNYTDDLGQEDATAWQGQVFLLQARLAQAQGNLEAARRKAEAALAQAQEADLPTFNYQVWQMLGELAEATGQSATALNYYCQAATEIERLRETVTLELRGDFLKDKMNTYESVVLLALEEKDFARAYDYIERSKSRALTELLAHGIDLQIRARRPADFKPVARLNELRAEHTHYYDLLYRAEAPLPGLRGSDQSPARLEGGDEREGWRQALRRCEKEIEALRWQLQVQDSDYAEDFSLSEVTSESPEPWLDADTLLVQYYIAREEVLAVAISAHERRVYRGLLPLRELKRELLKLSSVLQNTLPQYTEAQLPATQGRLGNLWRSLFEPVAEWAHDFQHLIFVPHGPLHRLPFQALYNTAAGRYLVQDWEVSYLPSASQLPLYRRRAAELRQEAEASGSVVLGYSARGALPFVTQEAQAVAAALGGPAQVGLWLEDEARRRVLEDLPPSCRVLHLATHGQFRADAPLFSFVELADGTLLTTDLFNLKLRAALITLSACESGLNVVTGGDELVGLSRACLYAGAASLLLSQWRVEDHSTTLLMGDFYRRLIAEGRSRSAALREAQLALLDGTLYPEQAQAYRHPYFWAAFCLIGEAGVL